MLANAPVVGRAPRPDRSSASAHRGSQQQCNRRLTRCRAGKDDKDALARLEELVPSPPPVAGEPSPPEQPPQGEGWAWFDRPAGRQTAPLRKRGMQPGSSGAYIDSERFTRDPLQLSVGDRTAAGDARALPEAKPRVAPALAAVVAAGQAAALLGLPWDLGMNNIEVALGARWQLLSASVQAVDGLGAAATLAALLTAGRFAEQRLGSVLFGASFAVAGGTSAVAWFGLSAVPLLVSRGELETLFAGSSGALLGPAAALLAFLAGNWRALEARQRGQCAAAALGLAAPTLLEWGLDFTDTPLDEALSLPVHGLSLLVGALLGAAAGPQLQVQQELNIQEGAMTISGDEEELTVVVDRRTAPQRWAAVGVAAAGLAAHAGVADVLVSASAADVALSLLGDPALLELQQELRREFRTQVLPRLSDEERARLYRQAPELFEGPRIEA